MTVKSDQLAVVPAEEKIPSAPQITSHSLLTLSDSRLARIKDLARTLARSKQIWGSTKGMTAPDIYLIMLKGIELGLEPMAAVDLIHSVNGKPTLSPQGMLSMIHRSGKLVSMKIDSKPTQCTVTMQRDKSTYIGTFTMENAKAMGLAEKDNWKKQPEVMLKWRAVSAVCREAFPDVIQGVYPPEELDPGLPVDGNGTIIEVVDFTSQEDAEDVPQNEAPPTKNGAPAPTDVATIPVDMTRDHKMFWGWVVKGGKLFYNKPDGSFHKFMWEGSWKKMQKENSFAKAATINDCIKVMFLRRCATDLDFDQDAVETIIERDEGNLDEISTLSEWAHVWALVKDIKGALPDDSDDDPNPETPEDVEPDI